MTRRSMEVLPVSRMISLVEHSEAKFISPMGSDQYYRWVSFVSSCPLVVFVIMEPVRVAFSGSSNGFLLVSYGVL
jgi:hypothetical protein